MNTKNKDLGNLSLQTSTPSWSKWVLRFNASGSSNNNFTSVSRIRWMAGTRTVMKACGFLAQEVLLSKQQLMQQRSSFPWETMSESSLWGCKDDQWLVWLVGNVINDLYVWTVRIILLEMPRAANNGAWRWDTVPPFPPSNPCQPSLVQEGLLANSAHWRIAAIEPFWKKAVSTFRCYIMLHPSREGCI